ELVTDNTFFLDTRTATIKAFFLFITFHWPQSYTAKGFQRLKALILSIKPKHESKSGLQPDVKKPFILR
ncbi:MAG: hypothetical protein ACI8ZN_001414, partial [Bacteroidia bacterium]